MIKLLHLPFINPLFNRWLAGNRRNLKGRNNIVRIGSSLLTRTRIRIHGDGNHVEIGPGCRLHDMNIVISGSGHRLVIGEKCQLLGEIKMEDRDGEIVIGSGTTMENTYVGVYDVGKRVIIGRDCMFAEEVGIRAGDMHSIIDAGTGRRINPSREVVIGDHVWLARGVTVLKGVHIGGHTVVGTHSLVTKDLPANALCGGVPAKVIREGISWDRRRLPE